MIFAKYGGNSIHRLSPNEDGTASVTTISNAIELNGPVGLAFGDNGDLYVGNYEDREIYRVLSDGSLQYIATVGDNSNLGFIDFAQGMIWGTVLGEHKIYRINPNGLDDVTVFAGSDGGTTDGDISVAKFAAPNGIKFNDSEDTMYVSEFNSKNIRIISGISLSDNEFSNKSRLKAITNSNEAYLLLVGSIFGTNSYSITISNIQGQNIYDLKQNNSADNIRTKIKTDTWPSGIYFVSIESNSLFETKKIVIK
jgi:sugar lactone lactonase YvrE